MCGSQFDDPMEFLCALSQQQRFANLNADHSWHAASCTSENSEKIRWRDTQAPKGMAGHCLNITALGTFLISDLLRFVKLKSFISILERYCLISICVNNKGMKWKLRILILLVAHLLPVLCHADPIELSVEALLDFRLGRTDETKSWLSRGFGKTRYGGDDRNKSYVARLSQASLMISASFSEELSARMQINVDAEPGGELGWHRIDVIEAFLSYRPVLSPHFRLRAKGGIFFPPVSLENRGAAWSPIYSITASAANSWIGEEVRVTGGEAGFVLEKANQQMSVSGAIFIKNDPAGTLLAWRGWTLSDRQTGLSDELPIAPILALTPQGLFPQQPPFVEPLREVDDRAGFYASGTWNNRNFEFNAMHYNNRGRCLKLPVSFLIP